jgi:hypothetical protein
MLEDIADYDAGKANLDEVFPAGFAERLIDGQNPIRAFRDHRGLTQDHVVGSRRAANLYSGPPSRRKVVSDTSFSEKLMSTEHESLMLTIPDRPAPRLITPHPPIQLLHHPFANQLGLGDFLGLREPVEVYITRRGGDAEGTTRDYERSLRAADRPSETGRASRLPTLQ